MKIASFFTGAGGLDYGFHQNFDVVLANDINKIACQSYKSNYSNDIHCGSFLDVPYEDYKNVNMMIGGPPCQGFSVNGKMNPLDPRNKLIIDFANSISYVKPNICVIENVPALLELKKWENIRIDIYNILKDYHIFSNVLNASHYGVFQARRRTIIIGFKKNIYNESIIQNLEESLNNEKIDKDVSIKNLLMMIGPVGKDNPSTCNAKITFSKNPIARPDPYGGFLFNGRGRFLNPNKPSPTIIASLGGNHTPIVDEREFFGDGFSYIKDYHSNLILDNTKIRTGLLPDYVRRLTIREAKAIQSFPDDYIFTGSNSSIYKQIGNAVPCGLSLAIAKSIKNII